MFDNPSLELSVIVATVIYAVIGIALILLTVVIVDKIFKLDLHKELVEDQNIAFGVLIGGISIAVSIVIAASISS